MILNVIGCGHLGGTLARLWRQSGTFRIGCVRNRSLASAQSAVAFIGAGTPVAGDEPLTPAEVTLIGTPDDAIEAAAQNLAAAGVLRQGNVVFHCSGSLPAAILAPVRACGTRVASAHPVHSFADPQISVKTFPGTFCALEGDEEALPILSSAFAALNARLFLIPGEHKALYHAATVLASNYLVALVETSLRCLEQAGVERAQGLELLGPLVTGTAANVFARGTVDALTGPVARGDDQTVARHLQALAAWNPSIAALYAQLGRVAADLSEQQGAACADALERIGNLLDGVTVP